MSRYLLLIRNESLGYVVELGPYGLHCATGTAARAVRAPDNREAVVVGEDYGDVVARFTHAEVTA